MTVGSSGMSRLCFVSHHQPRGQGGGNIAFHVLPLRCVLVPLRTTRGWEIMEGGSSSNPQGEPATRKMSELETLRQKYKENSSKVQVLKTQIGSVKQRLEKDIPDECGEVFKALSKRYDRLRTEYNALLPKNDEPGK